MSASGGLEGGRRASRKATKREGARLVGHPVFFRVREKNAPVAFWENPGKMMVKGYPEARRPHGEYRSRYGRKFSQSPLLRDSEVGADLCTERVTMKQIPTTKTKLDKLRKRAREIRAAEGLKLSAAQAKAATEAGYDDWHHAISCKKCQESTPTLTAPSEVKAEAESERQTQWQGAVSEMRRLRRGGETTVATLPIKGGGRGNYFFHIEIEGQRFQGAINDQGPYIQHHGTSAVSLGVCEIHWTKGRYGNETPGWYVCKHGPAEPRISLQELSPAGRRRLAFEFGIPIFPAPAEAMQEAEDAKWFSGKWLFYLSPAFRALCTWADNRPRKVKMFEASPGPYLFQWVTLATTAAERAFLLALMPAENGG